MLSRIELKKKSVGIIFHKKKHTRNAFLRSIQSFLLFLSRKKGNQHLNGLSRRLNAFAHLAKKKKILMG